MEAPRVFFMFFKLYKSYQIAQSITNSPIKRPKKYLQDRNKKSQNVGDSGKRKTFY